MIRWRFIFLFLWIISAVLLGGAQEFESDIIPTSDGDLKITFIGHGTLMFEFRGKVVHVDPVSRYADYAVLPKADLILVTHEHGDHLDPAAIKHVLRNETVVAWTRSCEAAADIQKTVVMDNGDSQALASIQIDAVPAYNIKHMRSPGKPFHPKGDGNGYILTFGDLRVYIAGDTENIPEMQSLRDIDVAFLPMNLPYTMDPRMAANAALSFKPRILYPYHFGNTDTSELMNLLKGSGIEIRIRRLE